MTICEVGGKRFLLGIWLALLSFQLAAGDEATDSRSRQAASLQITALHPAVRPGLLHRFQVQLKEGNAGDPDQPDQRRGTLAIAVVSPAAGEPLWSRELAGVSAQALRQGIVVNWLAPDQWPDAALGVELRWQISPRPLTARKPLADVLAIARGLEPLVDSLEAQGEDEPLPWLWLEQMAEELQGPTDLYGARLLRERFAILQEWLAGTRVGDQLLEQAWRDPSDGSVQPLRLSPAASPEVKGIIICLLDGPVHSKSRWPRLADPQRRAMTAAGWQVVEMFPAGDPSHRGHNRRRLRALISQQQQRHPHLPLVLFASGVGLQGAVWQPLLYPGSVSALVVDHGRWSRDEDAIIAADAATERWRTLHQDPQRRLAHLYGVPVFVSGPLNRHLQDLWQRRERVDGQSLLKQIDPEALTQEAWWQELLARVEVAPQPREYRVLMPGRYGPWLVTQVADPTRGGSLRNDDAGGELITGGLGGVQRVADAAESGALVPQGSGAPSHAGYHLGRANGPLSAVTHGPFVVVLGSGEHQAAADRNLALLDRFLRDWASHTWGTPPVVSDQAFRPEDWPRHHWLLIGGPRSNIITHAVQQRAPGILPVQWDHRSITIEGQLHPRSADVGVAMAVAHPQNPGRQVVVVDGRPVWQQGHKPFLGLADLAWRIGDGPVHTRLLLPDDR